MIKYEQYNFDLFKLILNSKKSYNKDKLYWQEIWNKRENFISKIYMSVIGKYPVIDESIDYFYSMSELANFYLNKESNNLFDMYIQHNNLTYFDYFNPTNFIFDVKERDFGNYLKNVFFKYDYKFNNIQQLLIENLNNYNYNLVFARLIYPEYYFEYFEKFVNNKEDDDMVVKKTNVFISKIQNYEKYLCDIYNCLLKNDVKIKKCELFNSH